MNINNSSGAETETSYHFMENVTSLKKQKQGDDVYHPVASPLLLTDVNGFL